jgi:hypothetical protein
MSVRVKIDWVEFLSGLFLLGSAVLIFADSLSHPIGSLSNIGPGAFPRFLGLLLGAVSIPLLIKGLSREGVPPVLKWRSLFFVCTSLLFFAFTIAPFGLIPAIFGIVLIVRLSEPGYSPLRILALAVCLAVLSWSVFAKGLALSLHAFRWPF